MNKTYICKYTDGNNIFETSAEFNNATQDEIYNYFKNDLNEEFEIVEIIEE